MASDRIRSKSTIGTRLSSLETAAENAAKSDNVGELSVLDSRVSKLESLSKDLSSFNWRLEQEYPSMDERYVLAGGGGGSSTQVTDWDLATEPGSYWSYMGGTLNAPVSAWLVGTVEDFGSGSNQLRVQSVYIANASEGQSGYGTVWRRYYNITTGTFTTSWAPLMPPAHSHTKADITDFAHTHDWSEVKAYPDTGNLFRNGYFRWGLTDWSVPADVTASVVTVPDGPNGQSTSVLRATPLDSDGGILNVLPTGTAEGQVIPGMTYDFILVARVVSGSTGNCRIRLGFQSTGLTNQWPVVDGTNLAGSSTNGVWQTLAGSYTVSPTEPRERMSAAIHFSGNNGSTTYEIASVTMIPRGIGPSILDLSAGILHPATGASPEFTNANDLKAAGIYYLPTGSTGTPAPGSEWNILVESGGGYSTQRATRASNTSYIYKRWLTESGGSTWTAWSIVGTEEPQTRQTRAVTASTGWSFYLRHVAGSAVSGTPHVSTRLGSAAVSLVLKNTSGSTKTPTAATTVGTGFPRSATSFDFPLTVTGQLTDNPGYPLTDVVAYITTAGALVIRGSRSIAANAIIDIYGVYPTND